MALITPANKPVPRGVILEHAMLPFSLYRPTLPVCHEIGHRVDVCPNPYTVKCAVSGLSNPTKEHVSTRPVQWCTPHG
ncbi:hypothetical protein HPB48_007211 [Haemaphysalis longicornis]|uniref:Uncharacterized protein n=1 Tax=Haemaphysalis longicornis TaxID=44386 RepID=A0A9J6G3W3_HAELO|nr:hypothetical protein HPB48_007211 [Haemaphysalis longicornis]